MEHPMKKIILFIILLFISSCENFADKPKDLLPQNTMAEIMADMALNDQSTAINTDANLELGTRFILKKFNIKADQFVTSYKYYVVTKQIPKIATKAQKIIKEKHPEAEKYIDNKLNDTSSDSILVR